MVTNRLLQKTYKKSSEPSPQGVLPGVTTHIGDTEATEGFGPLKILLGSIPAVHAVSQGTVAIGNKIEDLLSRIAALEARFAAYPEDVAGQRRRSNLTRKLKDIEGQLWSWTNKPRPQQPADCAQDDEVVSELLEDLRDSISDYQMEYLMAMDDQGCRPINPADAAVLNNFRCAQEAEYRHGDRKGCLKGTRRAVLDEIEHWSRDFDKPPVYWLNGLAGTGKSTIAQTIAERLFAEGQLGASFFCSRDFEDRSNLHFIFPTLAVQLARRYTEFRSIFVPLVQSDPGIAYESLHNQLNKLIVQPLNKSAISTVLVIDALDECKDEEPASAILSVLGRFVSEIPKIKIFVTGRPEPRIRAGFRLPLLAHMTDVLVLHEVELSRVNNDIRLFFRRRLLELASRRPGLDDWPNHEQLDLLCERAAGLFIYAVATVRFIDHKSASPKKQLDRLLQSPESSVFEGKTKVKASATLDLLYMSILEEAFGDDDPEDDPMVRSVLGAAILAADPLSPSAIAALLAFNTGEVFAILSSVHSLLTFQEDIDRPVQVFHKSFPEFIVDPARCTNPRFRIHPSDHHTELLVGCLELMNRNLEQNMCKLPDGVINSEVSDLWKRAERYIDHALRYACRSWHKHLIATTPVRASKTTPVLHQFLERKFLFWLEVLSVLGAAREAVSALDAAASWLNGSPTLDLINDYFRFVIAFFEVISTSAAHIYHSALPLSPQTSIIHKLYIPYARPLARVVQGVPILWEPIVVAVRNRGLVDKATWSPCSRYIAVSWSYPTTIELLDAATLERLHVFKPQHSTGWLSFSPDSRLLTQFGWRRHEITTWDFQTGGQTMTIPSTSYMATSQFFSSTYSIDGKTVAVAYRDPEFTGISTYNLLSGTHTYSYHISDGRIVASIWTHDECLRFATVKPGLITVWEVGFTSIHALTKIESLPAPDDISDFETILFLPTLSRLAAFHQKHVLIWDARGSKRLLYFSDGDLHTEISFSSDGRFFVCGTARQEIYLWKESPTGYVLHQTLVSGTKKAMGTVTWSNSITLLSPNGDSVIACRDYETRLWRTTDPITSLPSVPTRPTELANFLLEFSPDGLLAAAARWGDNIVTVLDLTSGNPRLIVDTGMMICGLRVTGNAIVVVDEERITTWNLPMGEHIFDTRATINDSVRTIKFDHPTPPSRHVQSAAISPDLNYTVITRGDGEGLDIYDMSTGNHVVGTATRCRRMSWITPDGCEVWSKYAWPYKGWKIIKDNKSDVIGLEHISENKCPSGGYPWRSSHGHGVTDDGWIFNLRKKRLMWLPHNWRKDEWDRKWDGRLLGLVSYDLTEPIIIELGE